MIITGAIINQSDEISSTTVKPRVYGKLLGCWISNDLKWFGHIQDSKMRLVGALSMRIFVLRKLQKTVSFKARKQISEGLFMSKLYYLVALWGVVS